MRRKILYYSLLYAGVFAAVSCSKEIADDASQLGGADSNAITLGVAGIDGSSDSKAGSSNVIILKSLDADAPELAVVESDFSDVCEGVLSGGCGGVVKSQEATGNNLGTLYGKFMVSAYVDDTKALHFSSVTRYAGGSWALDKDSEGKRYAWPMDEDGTYHALDFWAYTPDLKEVDAAGSFAVSGESSIDQLVFQTNLMRSGVNKPYTKDLIVAYKKQNFDKSAPAVNLQFRHALAAVGAYEDPDPYGNVTIVASKFEGILTEGKCVCTATGDGGVKVAWTPAETKGSYASSFEGGEALSKTNTHFLMPQTLGSDAKITITVKRADESLTDYSYSLAGTTWEAGRSYIYKLNYTSGAVLMQGPDFWTAVKNNVPNQGVESVEFKVRTSYKTLPHTVNPFVVSDSSSKSKAYAVYDGATKKLVITTSVDEIYSNTSMQRMFYSNDYYNYGGPFGHLKSVNFGPLNTKNTQDLSCLFQMCRLLTNPGVSNLDTSSATYMDHMFENNESLTTLDLRNLDVSKVINMSYMFHNAIKLTSLDISGWNTQSLVNAQSMFADMYQMTTLDLSNFSTASLTNPYEMFYNSYRLQTITLGPKFTCEKVTTMSSMFKQCRALTTLDVSKFKTDNVTNMASMFFNCNLIPVIDVSNWNTAKVENMQSMFDGCSSVTELKVDNFKTSNVTSLKNMFSSCSSLKSISCSSSSWNTEKVTDLSYMFNSCSALESVDISCFKVPLATTITFMFNGCQKLATLKIGDDFNTAKVTDMDRLFNDCQALASVNLKGFKTSKVNNMRAMFKNCYKLTTIDLSGFETSQVANMFEMFYGCKAATSIIFSSNFKTDKVPSMENMFRNCSELSSLDLSRFNTANVTNMQSMFESCYKLISLDLSSFNTANVTNMNSMLCYTRGIKSLKFSDNFVFDRVTDSNYFMLQCGFYNTESDKGKIYCSDSFWTKIQTLPGFSSSQWSHVTF